MGFVKTPGEVARIQRALSSVAFLGSEILSVDFLTDDAFVADVLPPGFEPARRPRITAMVGRWRSTCVGDFSGGAIYVSTRHSGLAGDYVLAMYMDAEPAILFGRDLYGEPKKLAHVGLFRERDRAAGYVERRGARLIELSVALGRRSELVDGITRAFNVKAALAADGTGLQHDAVVTCTEFTADTALHRPGHGSVRLGGTEHDPLGEIPIREVVGARYLEGDRQARCRALATIPADEFVPYAYGRMDDWSLLGTARSSG